MYRLLIVDDEPIIVNSIYHLLQGAAHLELDMYRAYNAYEALECLHKTRIDLIVSDIRMPGMNGIELQKLVMRQWDSCKIIFLTGYNDFEYAQEAIRIGGTVDYLLKNQNDELLVKAVEKAIAEIDKREDIKSRVLEAKAKLRMAMPALQKHVLADLIDGDPASAGSLTDKFAQSDIPLSAEKPVYLIVGTIDGWKDDLSEADRALMTYACRNIVDEYLSPSTVQVSVALDSHHMLWTVQPKAATAAGIGNAGIPVHIDHPGLPGLPYPLGQSEEVERRTWAYLNSRLISIVEAAQESCRKWLNLSVSFAVGDGACAWAEIGSRFYYLKMLLGQRTDKEQQLLIRDSGMFGLLEQANKSDKGSKRLRSMLNMLEQHLESGDKEAFFSLYYEMMTAESPYSQTDLLERFYPVSLCLVAYSIRIGLFHELTLTKQLSRMIRFDCHDSWADAVAYFAGLAEHLLDRTSNEAEDSSSRIVNSIHQYVKHNLDKDLSLTKLAVMVHHSPTYLSRLYKRLTGTMLFDFITEQRMNKAKELLSGSGMKIHEIATAVGYESAPHFTRSFKKIFGLTPQEYKDRQPGAYPVERGQ